MYFFLHVEIRHFFWIFTWYEYNALIFLHFFFVALSISQNANFEVLVRQLLKIIAAKLMILDCFKFSILVVRVVEVTQPVRLIVLVIFHSFFFKLSEIHHFFVRIATVEYRHYQFLEFHFFPVA